MFVHFALEEQLQVLHSNPQDRFLPGTIRLTAAKEVFVDGRMKKGLGDTRLPDLFQDRVWSLIQTMSRYQGWSEPTLNPSRLKARDERVRARKQEGLLLSAAAWSRRRGEAWPGKKPQPVAENISSNAAL